MPLNRSFPRPAAAALCLSVAWGAAGCHSDIDPPDASGAPAAEVQLNSAKAHAAGIAVAPVAYRELHQMLAASGRVTFDDQLVSHVFSPVNGRVTRLIAFPGQQVQKGEPLATIDSPDLGSAAADVAKARAAMAQAEREYQRQQELFAARASAGRDVEAAEAAAREARAELVRAEKRAATLGGGAKGDITQDYVLRAPIAGEVIARAINPGVEVQGQYSGGTAVELYTIGRLDRVWVLADVFEADLGRVHLGAPVAVQVVSQPDRTFNGKVDWIAGTVDPTTRTTKVRCEIENPDRSVKPEMYASVSIAVCGRQAVAIPRSALLRQGDQTVVFRQLGATAGGDLRYERWPVKVDDEGNDTLVPVLDGLKPGDQVVVSGAILLLGMISR